MHGFIEVNTHPDRCHQTGCRTVKVGLLPIHILLQTGCTRHQVHLQRAVGHLADGQTYELADRMADLLQLGDIHALLINLHHDERVEVLDRHAEFLSHLAVVAASIENVALEIRGLQRTEVLEAAEPFGKGQKGSSVMPHKRNPIKCENLVGLARLVRAYAVTGFENVALWHERDISHSSVERVAIADACIALDFMQHRLKGVIDGLDVYPEAMEQNLNLTNGLVFSSRVLEVLLQAGLARTDAYRLVQIAAMNCWDTGEPANSNYSCIC